MNARSETKTEHLGAADVLMQSATPEMYRGNAFRITGLNVNASLREIARRSEKLQMMEKLGNVLPESGAILPLDPPPDGDQVHQAMQRLHDPERRLADELFWFWPQQPDAGTTDEALAAMAQINENGAVAIWAKDENDVRNNGIATHNLAVLYHARALDLERAGSISALTAGENKLLQTSWHEAFKWWQKLLGQEGFWSQLTVRIRALDDPRLTAGTGRRMRDSLPMALLMINARMAVDAAGRGQADEAKRHAETLRASGFAAKLVEEALQAAVAPVRERIKMLCKAAEPEADADPANADKVTHRLIEQTKPLLAVIAGLLPEGNSVRDAAHDEVALRALACQIPFGNKTDNWSESLVLNTLISGIAASESAKNRIADNRRIIKSNLEYATCWFCKDKPAEDDAAVEVKMHGDVTRTPTYQGTNVQWRTSTIKVPRCGVCRTGHAFTPKYQGMALAFSFFLGMGGCSVVNNAQQFRGLPLLGIGFFFVCLIIGAILGGALDKKNKPQGIQPESGKNNYPRIKELQAKGWVFGEKPAGM